MANHKTKKIREPSFLQMALDARQEGDLVTSANSAARMARARVTPPAWAHGAQLHPLEESSPDPGNGEFFDLASFCRTCR